MPWLWPETPRLAQGMSARARIARRPFPGVLTTVVFFPTLF